jgi:hypothetical protein
MNETQVEMTPFTHHLFLVITEMPPVQTVVSSVLLVFLRGLACLGCMPSTELTLEGIQYGWNMVIELRARKSRCGA